MMIYDDYGVVGVVNDNDGIGGGWLIDKYHNILCFSLSFLFEIYLTNPLLWSDYYHLINWYYDLCHKYI